LAVGRAAVTPEPPPSPAAATLKRYVRAAASGAPARPPGRVVALATVAALAGLSLLALVTTLTGPSLWAAVAAAALIGLTAPDPVYLLDPVLVAGIVVIAGGVALGRALPGHKYPAYWR
ncbi:hypothetical protein ABZ815_25645, partial [Nonomuraea sp. NPDC047529]|uniref:hypothetical protein n=1 Tax=Nonomuraea sp. NPDC047529 TaxID=3155623 RepID=UPI0033DB1B36